MGLTLPTVSVTPGPTYGTLNNSAFTVIDSHNHTSGQGVQIPTLGININADLSFASFNGTNFRSTRYINQGSPLGTASDLACLYFSGGELYANDSSGNQVKITASGSVNVAGSGNITGMGATTATAVYTSGNQTFTWSSNTNVKAFMSCASVSIATTVASADSVTLASGTLSSGAYTLTLPTAVATTNNALLMSSNAGVLSYLPLGTANYVPVVNGAGTALTYALLTGSNITNALTLSGSLTTTTGITSGTSVTATTSVIATTAVYPTTNAKAYLVATGLNTIDIVSTTPTTHPIVVSANPATSGLMIVRGIINASGGIDSGEGFTVNHPSTGVYDLTFTNNFADAPAVVATIFDPAAVYLVIVTATGVAGCSFKTVTVPGNVNGDAKFSFVAIGQRLN